MFDAEKELKANPLCGTYSGLFENAISGKFCKPYMKLSAKENDDN